MANTCLILRRKPGQTVVMTTQSGERIEVSVKKATHLEASLAIVTDPKVHILRKELESTH